MKIPRIYCILTAACCLSPLTGFAQSLNVVADIRPVHSLVAMVMAGISEPVLLVSKSSSPHHYNLSPSEAEALESADVVFWTGDLMSPGLAKAISSIASGAHSISLLHETEYLLLAARELGAFEPDVDHDEDLHDEHGQDGDSNIEHDEDVLESDKDSHEDEIGGNEHASHDHEHHGALDPHAWLDPEIAMVWLNVIANHLSELDEQNANAYAANAKAAMNRISELRIKSQDRLSGLADKNFIVFHDAYQYFEKRFGLTPIGSITSWAAESPSAAHVSFLRKLAFEVGVVCAFSEPEFSNNLIASVTESSEIRISVLDPSGQAFEPGPGLYEELIGGMVQQFVDCLGS